MSLCIVFRSGSSLGSNLLFCESACAKACFGSFDKNKNKNLTCCYHLTEGYSSDRLICFSLCLRSCPRCSVTQKQCEGRWPPAMARSLSQSRRLPHALDLNSSWHHMYLLKIHAQPRDAMEGYEDAPYEGPNLPCFPPLSHGLIEV